LNIEVPQYLQYTPRFYTGSSVICDPPVLDSDRDMVVMYEENLDKQLRANGFLASDEIDAIKYPNSSVRMCYRKGVFNIIAVDTEEAWDRWKAATRIATEMNLLEKKQRLILFQYITEGCVRDSGTLNPDYKNEATGFVGKEFL